MSNRLSIAAAARAVGRTRQTLYAHAKQGKLSVQHDHEGKPFVYTSELLRVYGALQGDGKSDSTRHTVFDVKPTPSDTQNLTLFDTPDTQFLTPADTAFNRQESELALLREQLNFERDKRLLLEQQLEIERIAAAKIEDLLRMQLRLLTDQSARSEIPPAPVVQETPPHREPGPVPELPPEQSAILKKLKAKDTKKPSGKDKSKKGR